MSATTGFWLVIFILKREKISPNAEIGATELGLSPDFGGKSPSGLGNY